MDNFLQLLINGFDPSYVPPDITEDNAQEILDLISTISENGKELVAAESIAKSFYMNKLTVDTIVEDLKETVNQKIEAEDSSGKVVTLLTTDEYLRLLKGSPTLTEINQMRLFESYHLSEAGDLNVFVYEDALRLQQELITTLNSKALLTLMSKSGKLDKDAKIDPADPSSAILDYYNLKASLVHTAVSSLEYVSGQPKHLPQYLSLKESSDVTGLDDSGFYGTTEVDGISGLASELIQRSISDPKVTNAVALLSEANRDKNFLKQCRASLKLLSATLQTNLYVAIDDVRNYATRQGMRAVNQAAADISCKVYTEITGPILDMMRRIESDGNSDLSDILKRVSKVNKRIAHNVIEINYNSLHSKVYESVYKAIYNFQVKITELAQEDEAFYGKHKEKSLRISDLRETRWYIQQLDEAIEILDQAAASGDMNYFLEAYAFNLTTNKLYDYAHDKFETYRQNLRDEDIRQREEKKQTEELMRIQTEVDELAAGLVNIPVPTAKETEDPLYYNVFTKTAKDPIFLPEVETYINKWDEELTASIEIGMREEDMSAWTNYENGIEEDNQSNY